MNNDSFTEMTRESWLSRISGSIKGIIFGLLLFIAAFPLLWWNEGRSVERYNSLKEGLSAVISVAADNVDPANNGKLIHTQGLANTEEVLRDTVFDVAATAIKLIRHVSMYQWKENIKTETTEKVGGAKETKKTYNYSKDWSRVEINSGNFKHSAGHDNPGMVYKNHTIQANQVRLGAFKLNPSQIARISGVSDLSVEKANPPATLANKPVIITGNGFYVGNSPGNPQIGDLKISFQIVKPTEISLIAQQQGYSFSAYQTKAGSPIDLLKPGRMDADTMFAAAQKQNSLITWAIRAGGMLMMWLGLGMILRPLSVLASILPFLGDLVAMGTGLLAFLITLPCAMLTIALAWIAYRPLLAGGLIVVAVFALVAMKFMPRKKIVPAQV